MDTREKIITLAEFVRRPERGRWKTVIGVFDPFTLQVARMIRERANDGKLLVVVSPGNGTLLSAEARAALMAGLRGVDAAVIAEAGEARAVLTALGDVEIFEDAEADRRRSKEFVELVLESAQAAGRGAEQKRNSADLAAPRESVVREFLKAHRPFGGRCARFKIRVAHRPRAAAPNKRETRRTWPRRASPLCACSSKDRRARAEARPRKARPANDRRT